MGNRVQKAASEPVRPVKAINRDARNKGARKMLMDMRKDLISEGIGKNLPESRAAAYDIGDEGDHAGTEHTREVSILLSARTKQKLLAIEEALEKVREGTYGICQGCDDEIGAGRLTAMPLAKLCVACLSRLEKKMSHQNQAKDESGSPIMIGDGSGEEAE